MLKGSKYICAALFSFCLAGSGMSDPVSEVAIVGGVDNKERPYAALITSDGRVQTLKGGPFSEKEAKGEIRAVGINNSKTGIIGGSQGAFQPYAALFGPDGHTVSLKGSALPQKGRGVVQAVAMNDAGTGLLGGIQGGDKPYAALVSSDGEARPLKGPSAPQIDSPGAIQSVAINGSGVGILGGKKDRDKPYAALMDSDGRAAPLTGPALPKEDQTGEIRSVAINPSGAGILGGVENTDKPYAALFARDGTTTALKGEGAPKSDVSGWIQSVALNPSGAGLIGGMQQNKPYVALVAPDGTVTQLQCDISDQKDQNGQNKDGSTTPTSKNPRGKIRSVAINSAGYGILGGSGDISVALVNPDGNASVLKEEGASKEGQIIVQSVAMNNAGAAIVGGTQDGVPYVALIDPDGKKVPVIGDVPLKGDPGAILSVAINDSGVGIIGGKEDLKPYVALIDANGKAHVPTGEGAPKGDWGEIQFVAINNSGAGIIAGKQEERVYVALIDQNGKSDALSADDIKLTTVGSVAINDKGIGIIGGGYNPHHALLIDLNGKVTPLSGQGLPKGSASLKSVAINNSGAGLIGGQDREFTGFYAALFDQDGKTTSLSAESLPKGEGIANSVAINSSGAGIIGGMDGEAPYAALVDPDGNVTALSGSGAPQGKGEIQSVAINDSGVALIGGNHNGGSEIYAALVAPNGAITPLWNTFLQKRGQIYSIGFPDGQLTDWKDSTFNRIDPKSFGMGGAWADSLFVLSQVALGSHLDPAAFDPIPTLVADASETLVPSRQNSQSFAAWGSPLVLHAHHKKDKAFPALKNRGLGGVIGLDYFGLSPLVFGAGFAYTHQDAYGLTDGRRAQIRQELLTLYGSWQGKVFFAQTALWAGLSQMESHRFNLGLFSSQSLVKGALLSPHVKIGTILGTQGFAVRPFAAFDWAHYWQGAVKERGQSGLNLQIASHRLSILRSEFGVELAQIKRVGRGSFSFKEGMSYVNKRSFRGAIVETRYIQAISTFPISLCPKQTAHLTALFLGATFATQKRTFPLFSVAYQGEFGSKALVHALTLEVLKTF